MDTLKVMVGSFTWLLKYFQKNRAIILVQKLGIEKKMAKSVSGYLKTSLRGKEYFAKLNQMSGAVFWAPWSRNRSRSK